VFLVMEYVEGENLSRLLRAARNHGEQVPPRIAGSILVGALRGLDAAHRACDEHGGPLRIVHRDVSPQNILVGADGVSRLLDFGVAKAVGRMQTTRGGQIKGKLSYMPPEQLQGEPVDASADIYASAVVLWETLTGIPLFAGDTDAIVLGKVISGKVPPVAGLVPGLPEGIDAVLVRGLARNPRARYTTAREMADAVESCLGVAPAGEVAAWVERLAGSVLSARAEVVRHAETITADAVEDQTPETPPSAVVSGVTRLVASAAPDPGRGRENDADDSSVRDRTRDPRRMRSILAALAAIGVGGAALVVLGLPAARSGSNRIALARTLPVAIPAASFVMEAPAPPAAPPASDATDGAATPAPPRRSALRSPAAKAAPAQPRPSPTADPKPARAPRLPNELPAERD
jgi:serine/threonine-protein kinase